MAASMRSSNWPARPTKGLPIRSSSAPGASPINMIGAAGLPSIKTVFVAVRFSGQSSNPATSAASPSIVSAPAASRRADCAASASDSAKAPGGTTGVVGARRTAIWAGAGSELAVCVVEKGSEVGAHIRSGAVFEPRALNELIPDWRERGAPLNTPAADDRFLYLTKNRALRLPTPPPMHNHGNYIISLGNLCRWLAGQAEELGGEIYPGFAAAEVLYDEDGRVHGVATGDMGIGRDGKPTERYTPGVELIARETLFAEGCRGSLTKTLVERFRLRDGHDPQTYAIGLKELWEVAPERHQPGLVVHTVGWPLDGSTYGGSFLYHLQNQQVSVGFVIGLDYHNPFLNPFEEFQ